MDQESAARILLVRAVEEVLPQRIPPEGLLEAHLAAGDPAEGEPWIARRAAYLLEHSVRGHAAVLPSLDAIRSAPGVVFLAGVLVGLVSNYLGPSAKIHVLWNPIVILIAWNILVYAGLAGAAVVRGV
ncbi:MAG TPA: hypothetical protein VNN07_00750, partial [Candidatus Tectomicrobia bacterium]|nr:hypothetical protein [Candidatus Tectomicrobia bacterium]